MRDVSLYHPAILTVLNSPSELPFNVCPSCAHSKNDTDASGVRWGGRNITRGLSGLSKAKAKKHFGSYADALAFIKTLPYGPPDVYADWTTQKLLTMTTNGKPSHLVWDQHLQESTDFLIAAGAGRWPLSIAAFQDLMMGVKSKKNDAIHLHPWRTCQ